MHGEFIRKLKTLDFKNTYSFYSYKKARNVWTFKLNSSAHFKLGDDCFLSSKIKYILKEIAVNFTVFY